MTTHVILSGGIDSTVALAWALGPGYSGSPRAVSFDYGQRHLREVDAARKVARRMGVPHHTINLRGLLAGSALLGEQEVPHGHYAEDSMTATVVQGRNLLFAAAALAGTRPGDTLVLGVHAGDHPIYPDCRPGFWAHVDAAADAYDVHVATPFVHDTKADVVGYGESWDAPLHLTWSCYEGGEEHCGRCGTCVERAEAFHVAGVPDPTVYADPDFWMAATRAQA